MRDPARIDRVLKKLRLLWQRYPDLRLGQLIQNAKSQAGEGSGNVPLFTVEDDVMEVGLDNLMDSLSAVDRLSDLTESDDGVFLIDE